MRKRAPTRRRANQHPGGDLRRTMLGRRRCSHDDGRHAHGGADPAASCPCRAEQSVLRQSRRSAPMICRILAGHDRDLQQRRPTRGPHREDLFYGLNVGAVSLCVPPLRERSFPIWCTIAWTHHRRRPCPPELQAAVVARLRARYHWPGNVRRAGRSTSRHPLHGPPAVSQQDIAAGSGGERSSQQPRRRSRRPATFAEPVDEVCSDYFVGGCGRRLPPAAARVLRGSISADHRGTRATPQRKCNSRRRPI